MYFLTSFSSSMSSIDRDDKCGALERDRDPFRFALGHSDTRTPSLLSFIPGSVRPSMSSAAAPSTCLLLLVLFHPLSLSLSLSLVT